MSIHMSIEMSACMCTCMPRHMSTHMSTHMSMPMAVHVPISMSIQVSFWTASCNVPWRWLHWAQGPDYSELRPNKVDMQYSIMVALTGLKLCPSFLEARGRGRVPPIPHTNPNSASAAPTLHSVLPVSKCVLGHNHLCRGARF